MDDRLDRSGATLVDELLASLRDVEIGPWTPSGEALHQIRSFAAQLSADEQVALLKAVVALMPSYRHSGDPASRRDGTILYETAVGLYEADLPLGEADLAELLTTSRHDCGHGADTRPPFDLARTYMRMHGYSPLLGAAIGVFIDNLPNTMTTKVRELRRSAGLLSVLGDAAETDQTGRSEWMDRVGRSIAHLDAPERAEWEALILSMSATDRMRMPKNWQQRAESTIDRLGAQRTAGRLEEWWPNPESSPKLVLDGASGQLLKHFIWMLDLLPRESGEHLVCRIAQFDWPKSRRPLNVLQPALAYLEVSRSPEAVHAASILQHLVGRREPTDP